MTTQELNDIIKTLKTIPDGNDGMARAVLKAAADSITLAKIKELTDVKAEAESNEIIKESGPDHDKIFEAEVKYNGKKLAEGKGKSKKEAQMQAAKKALENLK